MSTVVFTKQVCKDSIDLKAHQMKDQLQLSCLES